MNKIELEYSQVQQAHLFVGMKGATLSVVTEQGELLFEQGLEPGNYRANDWLRFMEVGEVMLLEGRVTALRARQGKTKRSTYGKGFTDSGANPDFRPRRYTQGEVELQKMIDNLAVKTRNTDRRMKLLEEKEERERKRDRRERKKRRKEFNDHEELEENVDESREASPPEGGDEAPTDQSEKV